MTCETVEQLLLNIYEVSQKNEDSQIIPADSHSGLYFGFIVWWLENDEEVKHEFRIKSIDHKYANIFIKERHRITNKAELKKLISAIDLEKIRILQKGW